MIARLAGGSTWKTERLDRVVSKLTNEELAGALAGLEEGPAEVMLVKYAGHPIGRLHAIVYHAAAAMARNYRWTGELSLFRRMARLAVAEVVAPPSCPACLGRGIVKLEKYVACEECAGAGIGSLTWTDRNAILRIDHAGKNHPDAPLGPDERERYDAIYALVQGWESEGIAHLAWRLFGE